MSLSKFKLGGIVVSPADTMRVGKTDLRVTRMAFGAGTIGGMYSEVPHEQALSTIRRALSLGVKFFDVAPFYGHGMSEMRLGEGLRNVPRDSIMLATKVGRLLVPAPKGYHNSFFWNAAPFIPKFDYSYDGVMRSYEESLKRLGVDRIDILHIHDPDDHFEQALGSAFPALAKLRSCGAVGAIGVGMNQAEMLTRFAKEADFDCFLVAGRYTLIDQTALHELLPLCVKKNITVFIGGTYNSGILATGAVQGAKFNYQDASREIIEKVRRVELVCARHAVPLKAAAMQFPLAHPAVASVISGCRAPSEVEENARMLSFPIPQDFWNDLVHERLLARDSPIPTHSTNSN
jgi:D-threo-aldose 1-dehydrogenase